MSSQSLLWALSQATSAAGARRGGGRRAETEDSERARGRTGSRRGRGRGSEHARGARRGGGGRKREQYSAALSALLGDDLE